MDIPPGVNHLLFYEKTRNTNITITSRFRGVYMSILRGKPYWMARVQKGNKVIKSKRFPFNEKGEKMAGEFYVYHKRELTESNG